MNSLGKKISERKAFEVIYNKYFNEFYEIANHFIHDSEEAKGVVQESFIKLWQKGMASHPEQECRNYLFILVRNRCFNILRDKKRTIIDIDNADHLTFSFKFKMLEETGEEILVFKELQSKIEQIINDLPPQCKEVFRMSRFEELSNKEIAEKLGVTVKAIEANMTRALKVLRRDLKPYLENKIITRKGFNMNAFVLMFL